MSKYIEEWDESLINLIDSLTPTEREDINYSVWNNIINISTSTLLSSFVEDVKKLINEDKSFDEIYNAIRNEVKDPKKFLDNFAEFLCSKEFVNLFFTFLSENEFSSWSFDLDEQTSNKVKKFNVKSDDIVMYIIYEDYANNPQAWLDRYKFKEDLKIVDVIIDKFVANVISVSIDQSIEEG